MSPSSKDGSTGALYTNTYTRAENCIFAYLYDPGQVKISNGSNNRVVEYNELLAQYEGIEKDFVPKKGAISIDAGSNDFASTADKNGNQRVYNGRVDIGAYEYDWKGDYADYLKKGKVEVTEASPDVVLANDVLTLNPNSSLTVKTTAASPTDYKANFGVTGGTLTINGTEYTAEDSYTLKKPAADTVVTFSYAGTGTATIAPFEGGYEAMIGEMSYETFGEAYAIAGSSDTIKLLVGVTWAPVYGTDGFKTVAIDTNGFNLAVAQDSVTAFNEKGYVCKFSGTTLKVGLPFAGGDGTSEATAWTIPDYNTLVLFKNGVNAETYGKRGEFFKLTADIDFANIDGQNTKAPLWEGIGHYGKYDGEDSVPLSKIEELLEYFTKDESGNLVWKTDKEYLVSNEAALKEYKTSVTGFDGTFDGDGHTIANVVFLKTVYDPILKKDMVARKYGGFFNSLHNATIKNLKMSVAGDQGGYSSTDTSASSYGGGIFVGVAYNSKLIGLETIGDTAFKPLHAFGGIAGGVYYNTVFSNCVNSIEIAGKSQKGGGIVCLIESFGDGIVFAGCVNNGAIHNEGKADYGVSGIVGYPLTSKIFLQDCTNTAEITSEDMAGALIANFVGKGTGTIVASGANQGLACYLANAQVAVANLKFATVDSGIATYVADADIAVDGNYLLTAPLDTCNLQFTKNDVPRENPIRKISFDRSLYAGFEPTVTPAVGVKVTGPAIEGDVLTYTVRRRMGTLMILQ